MAHLHLRRWTRVRTRIRIPNPMATLYYAEHVHIAQIWTRIRMKFTGLDFFQFVKKTYMIFCVLHIQIFYVVAPAN